MGNGNAKTSSIPPQELAEKLAKILFRMLPFTTAFPEVLELFKDLRKSRTDMDQKITRAQTALTETSGLLLELETGVKERSHKLEMLKAKYDKYSKLAQIEEEKAKPLLDQVELSLGKQRGRERVMTLLLNLVAGVIVFVLGAWLGPYLAKWLGIAGK